MTKAPAPSLAGGAMDDVDVPAPAPDHLNLLGIIEAPTRDMRLAVFAINDRIVHGRVGDVIGERYRVVAFTEQDAELIDTANHGGVLDVAAAPRAAAPPAEPTEPAAVGALRVTGQPDFAEIYVDGAYVGTVAELSDAVDGLPLEPGPHRVDLQAPEHEAIGLAVRISPNRTTTYHAALPRLQP